MGEEFVGTALARDRDEVAVTAALRTGRSELLIQREAFRRGVSHFKTTAPVQLQRPGGPAYPYG